MIYHVALRCHVTFVLQGTVHKRAGRYLEQNPKTSDQSGRRETTNKRKNVERSIFTTGVGRVEGAALCLDQLRKHNSIFSWMLTSVVTKRSDSTGCCVHMSFSSSEILWIQSSPTLLTLML